MNEQVKKHAETLCQLIENYPPGSFGELFRELEWVTNYWSGKAMPLPAHTVPFAYVPGKTVLEKFLVQIETPETSEYCGCPCCRNGRAALWRAILHAQITNRLKGTNPFRVSAGHKLTILADERA